MKITMMYSGTISKLIKKYGYTWHDFENIQDYVGRVKRYSVSPDGKTWIHEYSLEDIFYCTHIGRIFDENGEFERPLIIGFLEALEEAAGRTVAV